MIIAVVGSRTFHNLEWVVEFIQSLPEGTFVLSGGANGVDQCAVAVAKSRFLGFGIYPPNWDKYGKAAGFLRNDDIVKMAELVVAFWDGSSKGTKDVIDRARHRNKDVVVIQERADLDALLGVVGTEMPLFEMPKENN